MKKVFVIILLNLSLASNILAQEKSGLFLGATGGLGFITGVFFDTAGNDTSWDSVLMKETTYSTALGIKGGYQYWFSPRVGVRTYLQYDFNSGRTWHINNDKLFIHFQHLTGNMDLMLNVFNTESFSLGIFGGFGLGYTISTWDNASFLNFLQNKYDYFGLAFITNVGVSTTFTQQHKVELGLRLPRLPVFYQSLESQNRSGFGFTATSVNLSYSYVF